MHRKYLDWNVQGGDFLAFDHLEWMIFILQFKIL